MAPPPVTTEMSKKQPLQERDTNANTTKPDKANESNDKKSNARNASKAKEPSKDAPTAAELSDIHLDGEIDENVKIYDTCDDIRKKINGHLKNTTQAAFARELSDLLPHSKINASHVGRYLKMKGPKAGGHNPVFYAAYVYFEKLRIKQGKKKSAKREKMEENWDKKGGFPREGSHNIYVTCLPGERWTFDQYGVPKQTGTPGRGRGGWTRKRVKEC